MKKALVVLLALAVVASGFAQPVADVNVAEFSGNASVTWGVDLDDDNATGFKNETEAKVVVNIFDAAEQSTEGDGIWAELVIKTDALKIVNEGKEGKFDTGDDGIRIDTAKLHFNDLYVGIKADGTKVGEFHLPRALNFEKIMTVPMTVPGKGPDRAAGIVAGYDSDLFSIALDFRNAGQYKDDYAIRAVAKVTPIENLDTYVGFSYAFEDQKDGVKDPFVFYTIDNTTPGKEVYILPNGDIYFMADEDQAKAFNELKDAAADPVIPADQQKGFGVNVLYKYELNDTFYLQPGVGYSSTFAEIPVDKTDKGTLGASLLFGFAGDPSDVGIGILSANAKTLGTGLAPKNDDGESEWLAGANAGVSVSTMLDLNEEGDAQRIPLFIDFNLGDALVENLGAVAFVRTEDVKNFTDDWALGVGVNYVLNADPAEVTLKAGLLRLYRLFPAPIDEMVWTQVEFGAEVGGLINNTTFSASYVSGNLTQNDYTADDTFKNGTINLTCKIAL